MYEKKILNKEVYLNQNFKILWDKIKYKTMYRLAFDTDLLTKNITRRVSEMDEIKPNKIVAKLVDLNISQKGINVVDPKEILFLC